MTSGRSASGSSVARASNCVSVEPSALLPHHRGGAGHPARVSGSIDPTSIVRAAVRRAVAFVAVRVAPTAWKERNELRYWKRRKADEGALRNTHYAHFYTAQFGLALDFYAGKALLDLGCGPRGSLEWADMAARRIGVDPLADEYRKLGADRHAMEYLAAPAERIPLDDASCDVVCAFNSLDHVDDPRRAVAEVKRLLRVGGTFLPIVEVNHPPTDTEPNHLTPRLLVEMLSTGLRCEDLRVFRPVPAGAYDSLRENVTVADPLASTEPGWLAARFTRVP